MAVVFPEKIEWPVAFKLKPKKAVVETGLSISANQKAGTIQKPSKLSL
jgi:hypothetical protein